MFFLFGLGMLAKSSALPLSTSVTSFAGPGTFPILLTVIIVVISGILIVKEIVKISKGTATAIKFNKQDVIRVLSILVSSVVYIQILPIVGFLVATIGFTALSLWIFGYRKKVTLVIISIVFPLIVFLIFKVFLNIPLP